MERKRSIQPEDEPADRQGAEGNATGRVAAIAGLPRLLGGALEDIAAIARGMQILPELARTLAAIERKVDSLDDEVKKMRRLVESIGGDVEGLHPRIEEVHRAIPLSGVRWRSGLRRKP